MPADGRRDEFGADTKDRVARRAMYICSNPNCRAYTLAPAKYDESHSVYTGRVAHITAAAPGGPRYDAALTPTQRRDVQNAIYLCPRCADEIDKNKGADYPADLLREWKSGHAEWLQTHPDALQESGLTVVAGEYRAEGEGEVTGMEIEGPAIIEPGTTSSAKGKGRITGVRIGSRKRR